MVIRERSSRVVLENLALRQQLSIYKRTQNRPRLAGRDRWFWIALSVVWQDWRQALCVVHPDTVVRWQRERVRRYWAHLSERSERLGRPPVSHEVCTLIRSLAQANPLWHAPRIRGELRKLGIEISERTVSRVLRIVKRPPSQTRRTFLRNQVLFVFLIIEHQRRKILHFDVTEHPTAEWAAQQVEIRLATPGTVFDFRD